MKYIAFLVASSWATNVLAATAWENYLDLPTPANAALVQTIEYSAPVMGGYDAGDLDILEAQIRAADAQAFRLAYRLYTKADGGLAEELGVMLGRVVRVHPAFFLAQVSALKVQCEKFKWPLNASGLEYVDRIEAQVYEINQRREALKSVTDENLISIRDQCIRQFVRQ